jgi:hypothetical protein
MLNRRLRPSESDSSFPHERLLLQSGAVARARKSGALGTVRLQVLRGLSLGLFVLLASCEKGRTGPVGPTPVDGPKLTDAAQVVDSLQLELISSPAEREAGLYRFVRRDSQAQMRAGDVIVGAQGAGFLRQVNTVAATGDTLRLTTGDAALTDLVAEGSFQQLIALTLGTDSPASAQSLELGAPRFTYLAPGVVPSRTGLTLNRVVLLDAKLCGIDRGVHGVDQCVVVKFGIERGHIGFDANLDLGADIDFPAQLQEAHLAVEGRLQFDVTEFLEASSELHQTDIVQLQKGDRTILVQREWPFRMTVAGAPVSGTIKVTLVREWALSLGDIQLTTGFRSQATTRLGARYVRGQGLSPIHEASIKFTPDPIQLTGATNGALRYTIKPEVTVSFYGTTAQSFVALEPYTAFRMQPNVEARSTQWDWSYGIDGILGVRFNLFGRNLGEVVGRHTLYKRDILAGTVESQPPSAAAPSITGYSWNPSPPKANQSFGGTVRGSGFVTGATAVWFCKANTDTCYQHPAAGVTVSSASSLAVANVQLAPGSWQVYVRTSAGASGRSTPFTVEQGAAAPSITGYSWNPSPPKANQSFSGTVSGSGFVAGATAVWFCKANTDTCYQHPAAGVTVSNASGLSVVNVQLGAGNWQVYVRTSAGASNRSTAFTVEGVAPTVSAYTWNPSPPKANQNFGGMVAGSGFVAGATEVWFCKASTDTCFQHPTAGITVANAGSLSVVNVQLSGGNWQVYVRTSAGVSGRSSAFTVQL